MRQMTLSSQAVAASLPSSPAQLHSPAISLSSAASQDPASATGVAPQDSAIFLAPSGSADVPTAFSPRTAHFLAGTGASGNTPQFASFAQNNSFLDEHQKTAMTTPMASSWRSKGGATPLASTEDANQPAYWDNAAVPVSLSDEPSRDSRVADLFGRVRLCPFHPLSQTFSLRSLYQTLQPTTRNRRVDNSNRLG